MSRSLDMSAIWLWWLWHETWEQAFTFRLGKPLRQVKLKDINMQWKSEIKSGEIISVWAPGVLRGEVKSTNSVVENVWV
jgi:hypothetical protein